MDNLKWEDPDKCAHYWTPRVGEQPEFRPTFIGFDPVAHVKCVLCNARTWFTEEQWNDIPAMIDPREGS